MGQLQPAEWLGWGLITCGAGAADASQVPDSVQTRWHTTCTTTHLYQTYNTLPERENLQRVPQLHQHSRPVIVQSLIKRRRLGQAMDQDCVPAAPSTVTAWRPVRC